jgi:hypothetical protein
MRGLTKGEQSSRTSPVLQLFVRQGEHLVDPVEGSYIIEDVKNPDADPISRVSTTALDLDLVADGGHKLGTGRFVILTGDTSAWAYGTQRVTYRYKMEVGGKEYIQITYFEILSGTLFATGQGYIGYASTRDLYRDEFFAIEAYPPEKLHSHIRRVSASLESLLMRFFEPRYVDQRIDGSGIGTLFLNEAIVAMDTVSAIQRNSDGTETLSAYDSAGFTTFNRHMDGLLNPDDRDNPKLSVALDEISGYVINGWCWPTGRKNLSVKGVFGYLDPDPESDGILIGHTPDDFIQILGILIGRYIEDPTMSSPATWQPGKIKSYKTRDQQIQFYGASGNVNYSGGITGDATVDQLLLRFVKPARLSYPERDAYWGVY